MELDAKFLWTVFTTILSAAFTAGILYGVVKSKLDSLTHSIKNLEKSINKLTEENEQIKSETRRVDKIVKDEVSSEQKKMKEELYSIHKDFMGLKSQTDSIKNDIDEIEKSYKTINQNIEKRFNKIEKSIVEIQTKLDLLIVHIKEDIAELKQQLKES